MGPPSLGRGGMIVGTCFKFYEDVVEVGANIILCGMWKIACCLRIEDEHFFALLSADYFVLIPP